MIVLGIATATPRVGCAVGGVEGVLAEFGSTHGPRHVEALVPAIEFTCRQAGIALREISVVAVDIGPGLFTGLRVGIAAAKAMATALRVPMIGMSSLDLLAYPLRFAPRVVVPVVDARRGEVFWAPYRHVPGGIQRMAEPASSTPAALAAELEALGEEVLLAGDGALRHAGELASSAAVEVAGVGHAHPTAGALVELAHPRAVREEFVTPAEIRPLYLRKPDAEINWERRDDAVAPHR